MHHISNKNPTFYLAQHSDIAWYSWGEDAFLESHKQQKPIFLSIGFASCHWCYGMHNDVLSDAHVSSFLNQHFINIILDKDERPDIAFIYSEALRVMGIKAGWPINIFLTPNLMPFFGGTYFPVIEQHGLPAFIDICKKVIHLWKYDKEKIIQSGVAIFNGLEQRHKRHQHSEMQHDYDVPLLLKAMDEEHGGFQASSKFIQAPLLSLLANSSNIAARQALLFTIDRVVKGGIMDQLDGGIHRYSIDETWRVGHFEKMLYDQALIIPLLNITSPLHQYSDIALERVITFVHDNLLGEEGCFISSLIADNNGVEGGYYILSYQEILEALAAYSHDNIAIFLDYYNITDQGIINGYNILNISDNSAEIAQDMQKTLEPMRQTLAHYRQKRFTPTKDITVITSWNGLMIAALIEAGICHQQQTWLNSALNVYNNLKKHAFDDAALCYHHSYCNGHIGDKALLGDYAAMLYALSFIQPITAQYDNDIACLITIINQQFAPNNFKSCPYYTDSIVTIHPTQDSEVPSDIGLLALGLARLYHNMPKTAEYNNELTTLLDNIMQLYTPIEQHKIFTEPTLYRAYMMYHYGGVATISPSIDATLLATLLSFAPLDKVIRYDDTLRNDTLLWSTPATSSQHLDSDSAIKEYFLQHPYVIDAST